MEVYTKQGITFTKIAKNGIWALFEANKNNVLKYDVVMVSNAFEPYSDKWIKQGFTFSKLEDAVIELKNRYINQSIITEDSRILAILNNEV